MTPRISCFVILLAACGERPVPAVHTTVPDPVVASDVRGFDGPLDASLFVRDQPMLSGLSMWGDVIVARGAVLQTIDLGSASATRLAIEGASSVIDVAETDVRIALVRTERGISLLEDRDGWSALEAPPELSTIDAFARIAADRRHLAVLAGDALHVRRDGRWSHYPHDEETMRMGAVPSQLVIAGDRLYAGYDRGEWGGRLLAFDLGTGRVQEIATQREGELALPVRGLGVARDGRLWIARGLAHLGLRRGRLGFLHTEEFTLVSSADEEDGARTAWSLEPQAFDAMALDAADRVYVATGSLGVVRRDAEHWTRLTPGWPSEHVYVSGLLVYGETLVIGLNDAGILLVDGRGARRVALLAQ
jgi:hypothetical protein